MGVEIVRVPHIENLRVRNQAWRFTLSRTPFRSLEEYVATCDHDRPVLTQMAFPAADAEQALADLAMMGWTPSRLFPDVGGAAEAAKLRVLLAERLRVSHAALG